METVLFDGDCGFCRTCVAWASRHLVGSPISFVPRESCAGQKLMQEMAPGRTMDSVVFLDGSVVFTRSDAVLAILSRCRLPWRWARVSRFVPRLMRDSIYDLVARYRGWLPFKGQKCAVIQR